ncbi:MAG TPA: glycosyltransferase family 2 protein [Gaiellaceae bacterium]|nr:glycosyltransferase family 2 protein [Gaiellaceae bacterium]
MTRPVHVVVVAYGAADQLDFCLSALGAGIETTVVDNSGSPAVREAADRPGVDYIDPGRNLGFGAGVNLALQTLLKAAPRDVLLLNPDAVLDPGQLETLTRYLHRRGNERVAAVSPRLMRASGLEQRVVWPFPTPLRCWADAVGLSRVPARDSFVIGAALLLRWEALQDVGLFDERFFLYAEETDWQRRARALGWTSSLCRDAVGVHAGAGTATDTTSHEALFHAAQETYIRKWYGTGGWLAYRLAACSGATARALVRGGERRAAAARRARLYARGPRRCAGLAGNP